MKRKKQKEAKTKISRKEVLKTLDQVKNEYKAEFDAYDKDLDNLYNVKEISSQTIADSVKLINSFASKPKDISKSFSVIKEQFKDYQSSKDLLKEEHKKEASAGLKGTLGFALAGGAVLSFKEFLSSKSDDDSDSKTGLVILLIIGLLYLAYLVWSFFKTRIVTVKKALKNTEAIKREIHQLSLKRKTMESLVIELTNLQALVAQKNTYISSFSNTNFKKLTEQQKKDLYAFVNHVNSLSELLNKDI